MWGFVLRAVALVAVSLLVGCGGGGSADDSSPATAVPADAVFYGEMVVRPEGSLRSDALDAAGKVLATDDPEARIRELLREASRRTIVDYERDVEPWLGDRVGFWSHGSGEHAGVVLLAADDPKAARESVEAVFLRGSLSFNERSHGGVDYVLLSDGVAAGIVDEWLAVGGEREVVRTIDAAAGDSLAETDEYADAIGRLPENRLAHFWADTAGLFDAAMRRHPDLDQLRGLVPIDDLLPVAGAFLADGERLALEVEGRLGVETRSTPLVGELPGDAWAAAGAADLGRSLRDVLDRFGGAIGGLAVRARVRDELGLDLDRDVLDWIGDTAFFMRGTTPESLDGGLVIRPTDEARAADAFGRIVGAIQQASDVRARPVEVAGADQAFAIQKEAPKPLVLARGSGLVVATYGEAAAEAALGSGSPRLADSDLYAEAENLAGTEPSLLVSMPHVLELAPEARRHLEAFSVVAAGARADGNEATVRLVAGLR